MSMIGEGKVTMCQTVNTQQKTICFFGGDVTRCGGTERASTMIANLLHRQGMYRVIFLSLMEHDLDPFFPLDKGIIRYRLGDGWINPGPGYLKNIPKLRKFFRHQDVDIIIDADIVLDCLSIPASMGLKTKVISWEHFNCQFERSVLYRKLILKYLVRRSDYVITLTERDKDEYIRYIKRQERIQAICNPIEEPVLMPEIRKEKWIITIGRLVFQKGPEYLIEVAQNILKKYPDWQWILLGEGEMRPILEDRIRDGQLGDRLILQGNVQNVSDYLQRSQIYVMTSRYEGLGICLLEAKVHGLPCIAFDVPMGPAELIMDGTNGYLIPAFACDKMEEKIERLIVDAELRERFSLNAKFGMDKYRPDFILEQWNQVIEQVC